MRHLMLSRYATSLLLLSMLVLAPALMAGPARAEPALSLTVDTDHPAYNAGQPVTILGTLLLGGSPVVGVGVSVQVTNPSSATIFIDMPTTNDEGAYTTAFTLSGSAPEGTYTVYAAYDTASENATFDVPVPVSTTCPSGYDTQSFAGTITISGTTTWDCVDYSVDRVVISPSGVLTIQNSFVRHVQFPVYGTISESGELHLINATITLVSLVVGSASTVVFTVVDSHLIESLQINAGTGDTLSIADFAKSQFNTGWTGTDWNILDRTLEISTTVADYIGLLIDGGTASITNSQIDYLKLTGGTETTSGSAFGAVDVSGAASASIQGGSIGGLIITPSSSPLTITGFTVASMLDDYNFETAWGMALPHLEVNTTTVARVSLIVLHSTVSVSTSNIYGVYVEDAEASVSIDESVISNLSVFAGLVHATDSTLSGVFITGGTLTVDPSVIPLFIIMGGTATLTSTTIGEIFFSPLSGTENIVIASFDPTLVGGDYTYDSWGWTSLHLTTVTSTVASVSIIMDSGGTIQAANSIFSYIQGSDFSASLTNCTATTGVAASNGADITLLNSVVGTEFVSGTGLVEREWYANVNVYNAITLLRINGVTLHFVDHKGTALSSAVDGHVRLILKEYDHTTSGYDPYYPYSFVASKSGFQSASTVIAHFSNPVLDLYLLPSTSDMAILTPPTGTTLTPVTLSGTGWGSDLSVTFQATTGGDLWEAPLVRSCAVVAGAIQSGCVFTVKANAFGGIHNVTVTGSPSGNSVIAQFYVIPQLHLVPHSGPSGTFVTVTGSGFNATYPGNCVSQLSSSPAGLMTGTLCTLNADGTVDGSFNVASAAMLSPYTVTLSPLAGNSASDYFTKVKPAIIPTPDHGPRSSSFLIAGVNFNPGDLSCGITSTPDIAASSNCNILNGVVTGIIVISATAPYGPSLIKVNGVSGGDFATAYFNVTSTEVSIPTIVLTPDHGPDNQVVAVNGVNFQGTDCVLSATPSTLFTSQYCHITAGVLTGTFTVSSTAHDGGYTVTATTSHEAPTKTFQVENPAPTPNPPPTPPPSGPLSVTMGSPHLTVNPGNTVSFALAVASGSATNVTLAASNVPSGWAYTITPNAGYTNPQFAAVLTITVPSTAMAGSTTVTVTATAGNGDTAEGNAIVEVVLPTPPTTTGSKCIIATAAYGSEMAPAVVQMRFVRDKMIGSTPTGKVLRDGFNTFYYLWSPTVAQAVASSDAMRAVFRVLLQPLVGIVYATGWVFTALGGGDFASVIAFLFAAVLATTSYIVAPALIVKVAYGKCRGRLFRKQ